MKIRITIVILIILVIIALLLIRKKKAKPVPSSSPGSPQRAALPADATASVRPGEKKEITGGLYKS